MTDDVMTIYFTLAHQTAFIVITQLIIIIKTKAYIFHIIMLIHGYIN